MESLSEKVAPFKVSVLDQFEVSPARIIAPIECDELSFAPPKKLAIAGFSWAARKSGTDEGGWEIDENLIDTVVAWSALGATAKSVDEKIECVLEIDYRDEIPAEDIVHLASSGEFSIALVGLADNPSGSAEAQYIEKLLALSRAMLGSASFSKSFYPFSNEFEIYFLERMGKTKDAEMKRHQWSSGLVDTKHVSGARSEYALARTPLGRMSVRLACIKAVVDHFGGEADVELAMKAMAKPIAKRVSRFIDEMKAQPKAKQERFDLSGGLSS